MLTSTENKAISLKEKGNVFFNQGNYINATNCYNQAIQIDIKFKEAWLNKALCHQKLDQIKEALDALTQAIIIDSLYAKAIYNKASILISMQNYELAIETINRYTTQGGEVKEIISLRKNCANKNIVRLVGKSEDESSIEINTKTSRATTERSALQLPREISSSTTSYTSNTLPKNNYQPEFFSDNVLLETQARNIPILAAILNKNIDELNRLLQEKADVNIHVPGGGKTPLHLAVELNQEAMVALLIEAKADVNAVTRTQKTPLHVAAQKGNVCIINRLLDAGATIDAACDVGCTPLHEAAANGHQEAVIALVTRNANSNLKDYRFNLTAYELAVIYNKHNITAILKPELIKDLIYRPAIEFIKTAFSEKCNQSIIWEICRSQNNIYAKVNMNFTFEKDAALYAEKLHSIGIIKAFTKKVQKGWELIVPNLEEVLSTCRIQEKYSQSPVVK